MDLQLKHKKNKKKRQNTDKLQKGLSLFCFFFFFNIRFQLHNHFLLLGLWIAFNLCFFHMGFIHFAVLIWWCPRLLWKFFSSFPKIWNLEWVDYANLTRCLWFAISILDFWYGIVILKYQLWHSMSFHYNFSNASILLIGYRCKCTSIIEFKGKQNCLTGQFYQTLSTFVDKSRKSPRHIVYPEKYFGVLSMF